MPVLVPAPESSKSLRRTFPADYNRRECGSQLKKKSRPRSCCRASGVTSIFFPSLLVLISLCLERIRGHARLRAKNRITGFFEKISHFAAAEVWLSGQEHIRIEGRGREKLRQGQH